MLAWLKWFFWESVICKHEPGEWQMRDLGMGKVKHCIKCGKCLELI
jgi:hypothetical protein